MMSTVAGNQYAIGYISLGSLNDEVKALKIDGAEASAENVENGSYKVSRPFNIVTKDGLSADAQDFMDYILSTDSRLFQMTDILQSKIPKPTKETAAVKRLW